MLFRSQNATLRGMEILEATDVPVRILQIPEGKDPDDYVRTHGADRFRQLTEQAMTPLQFRLLLKQRENPGGGVEDRVHMLTGMAEVLAAHENAIEREMSLARISEEYHISMDSLRTEVEKRLRKRDRKPTALRVSLSAQRPRSVTEGPARNRYDEGELILLCLLANDNRLFEDLLLRMPLDRYRGTISRMVAQKLYDRLQTRHEASLAELVNDLPADAASAMIHMAQTRGTVDDADRAVEDLLKRLERMMLEDQKGWVLESIRGETDPERRSALGIELNRVITRLSEGIKG